MTQWVFALLLFALPSISFGTITILGASGASNYVNTNGNVTIYGGIAGTLCTGDGINTCNTCLAPGANFTAPCNEQAIYPNLNLAISFNSGSAGYPTIGDPTSGISLFPQGPLTAAGTAASVPGLTWSQICQQLTQFGTATKGTNDCNFNGSGTFRIGTTKNLGDALGASGSDATNITIFVQKNVGTTPTFSVPQTPTTACTSVPGDGICNFQMKPGDQKAILFAATPTGGFPASNNVNFGGIRVYYRPGPDPGALTGFTNMTPANSPAADFTFHTDANNNVVIDNDTIPDLVNGTRYYFIIGTVDLAKNIGFFSLPTSFNPANNPAAWDFWSVVPEPVYGLLGKNFECFVATATYGTPDAKEVKTLRAFRDYLLQYHRSANLPWIRFYYNHGPKLAAFIRDNEFLKSISRTILWYPIKFAKMTLEHGLGFAFLMTLLPLLLLGLIIHGWWKLAKKAAYR